MKAAKGIKRPSLRGMKHTKHLGHFAKDKWIQKGHNDVESASDATGSGPSDSDKAARDQVDHDSDERVKQWVYDTMLDSAASVNNGRK